MCVSGQHSHTSLAGHSRWAVGCNTSQDFLITGPSKALKKAPQRGFQRFGGVFHINTSLSDVFTAKIPVCLMTCAVIEVHL